jgi:Ca2+-binding RTX toxin-like protein
MMLNNLIGGLTQGRSGTRRGGRSLQRQFQPCLDALEGRELKDGGISLIGNMVNITGAAAQNTVVISYTDSSHAVVAVSFNNTTVDYNHADVTSIHFVGQDGPNLLENLTDIATYAKGGDGFNDFLGSSGHDTFIGGDGTNFFIGAGGNDTLVGGKGVNFFFNVTGNDSVTVGNGMNFIY